MSTQKSTKFASSNMPYSRRIMDRLAESEELKIAGEHVKAIRIAEEILLEDPACLAAVEELADNFLSLEKYEQAEKAAVHVLKLDGSSYIANYTNGFLELARGNWKSAVAHLQKANIGQTNNPEILRCLGWGLFHIGKREEGKGTLKRALNLRSDDPMILCDLGVCLLHCDDFKRSVELFERAIDVSPLSERAQECLQAAKDLQKKFEKRDTHRKKAA